jgi:hypothetical protein
MYRLAMACNDSRNGSHRGFADAINVTDETGDGLHLVGDRPVSCGVVRSTNSGMPRFLRIGHLRLRIHSYRTWVCNWCYDEASMDASELAKAVNYLRKRGWRCEGGYVELTDKYEGAEALTVDDFTEVVVA